MSNKRAFFSNARKESEVFIPSANIEKLIGELRDELESAVTALKKGLRSESQGMNLLRFLRSFCWEPPTVPPPAKPTDAPQQPGGQIRVESESKAPWRSLREPGDGLGFLDDCTGKVIIEERTLVRERNDDVTLDIETGKASAAKRQRRSRSCPPTTVKINTKRK